MKKKHSGEILFKSIHTVYLIIIIYVLVKTLWSLLWLFQVVEIADANRLTVMDGDLVGIHYENGIHNGLIPYENSEYAPSETLIQNDLSTIFAFNIRNGELPVGVVLSDSVTRTQKRLPALRAYVEGKT